VAAQSVKTVHLVTRAETLKALYFDWQTQLARPNLVFIDGEGTVVFETNEIGLKGEPVDERRKLVVVWGDSIVFGAWRGWASLLDTYAPGYQFLNGGIEGDPYDNILRRARRLNRERPVVLNVVMPGWHPFEPYPVATPAGPPPKNWWRRGQSAASEPGKFRAELTSFIRDVPNTVLLTMPASLIRLSPPGLPRGILRPATTTRCSTSVERCRTRSHCSASILISSIGATRSSAMLRGPRRCR
jgi:hypothetical protein